MTNVKVYQCECPKCHSTNSFISEKESEGFKVCYQCGHVELDTEFEVTDFLVDLVHYGINRDSEMEEVLTDKLAEEYSWLEFIDAELLAKLMVNNLADVARFRAEAEDQEAAEFYHEKLEAAIGV